MASSIIHYAIASKILKGKALQLGLRGGGVYVSALH